MKLREAGFAIPLITFKQGIITAEQADAEAHRRAYLPAIASTVANTVIGGVGDNAVSPLQRIATGSASSLADSAIGKLTYNPELTREEALRDAASAAATGGVIAVAHPSTWKPAPARSPLVSEPLPSQLTPPPKEQDAADTRHQDTQPTSGSWPVPMPFRYTPRNPSSQTPPSASFSPDANPHIPSRPEENLPFPGATASGQTNPNESTHDRREQTESGRQGVAGQDPRIKPEAERERQPASATEGERLDWARFHQELTSKAQQNWLDQRAHAVGYSSEEDMLKKAPNLYKNLSAQWLASHPGGPGAILQQTSIHAINEKLFGKSPASPTEGNVYGTGKTENHRRTSSGDAGRSEGDHLQAGADIAGGNDRPALAAGGGVKAQSREEITRAIQQRVTDWARDRRLLVDKLPPEWTPNSPNDMGGVEHHV